MKKPKFTARQRAKARRVKLQHNAAEAAVLLKQLIALGDFDANAPHIRILAILVEYLYQRELGNE